MTESWIELQNVRLLLNQAFTQISEFTQDSAARYARSEIFELREFLEKEIAKRKQTETEVTAPE